MQGKSTCSTSCRNLSYRARILPASELCLHSLTDKKHRPESASSYLCKQLVLREVRRVAGLGTPVCCHSVSSMPAGKVVPLSGREESGIWGSVPMLSASASQIARNGTHRLTGKDSATDRDSVPLASIRQGDSPRLSGEDQEHVRRLAECDVAALPPVVVHRPTMRVIDGMHRLRVAELQGRDRIDVEYFDGSEEEAFAHAVELNVAHGLPLSLADRKEAAARILAWRPEMSDRAVAAMTGLSPKTAGAIRSRAAEEIPHVHERVGSDGRRHPLDRAGARRRAAEALAARPDAPLREIAATAGVSLGTVRRVRELLRKEEDNSAGGHQLRGGEAPGEARQLGKPGREALPAVSVGTSPGRAAGPPDAQSVLQKLRNDPSLRHSEAGRALLRWLHGHSVDWGQWDSLSRSIPPHSVPLIASLARHNASAWEELASGLEKRPKPGANSKKTV
jgi:ParB-like chromosome segregation protein Spo0J